MTRLHLTHHGQASSPPIVWLGSLGSTTAMWERQLAALDDRAHSTLVDLPGHGASGSITGPATITDLADAVARALDEADVGRAHVVGLSIGGMIAMALAAHHARRVQRLVVLCTSARLGPASAWYERAATVRAGGTRAVAATVVGRWLTPAYAESHPDEVAAFVDMISSTDADGYATCCEAIAAMDLRDDLPSIVAPTLVIAGTDDPATPPEHGELIASLIPGARLQLVEAAHLANWERADEVTALLAHHLLESSNDR